MNYRALIILLGLFSCFFSAGAQTWTARYQAWENANIDTSRSVERHPPPSYTDPAEVAKLAADVRVYRKERLQIAISRIDSAIVLHRTAGGADLYRRDLLHMVFCQGTFGDVTIILCSGTDTVLTSYYVPKYNDGPVSSSTVLSSARKDLLYKSIGAYESRDTLLRLVSRRDFGAVNNLVKISPMFTDGESYRVVFIRRKGSNWEFETVRFNGFVVGNGKKKK